MRSLLTIALATALCAACGESTPTGGCANPQIIDDMEDNDRFICASAAGTATGRLKTMAAARASRRAASSRRA